MSSVSAAPGRIRSSTRRRRIPTQARHLVLSESSNVPISHAVCASASLPGVFALTWIGDRLCMDGAMCSTSTHVDLIAGAKRALVVALTDKGSRFSNIPNDIEQELRYVEA